MRTHLARPRDRSLPSGRAHAGDAAPDPHAPLAVNTLAQVMMDTAAPASSKVAAATTILRFGREGIELDDLGARVEALEQAAPQRQKSARWAS